MSKEKFIVIGRVLRERGVKGEMAVLPLAFDPERFLKLCEIGIQTGKEIAWKKIRSVRFHKDLVLISIEGCDSPEEAKKYRGAGIMAARSESPELPQGVYYHYQIIGLEVYTTDGDFLGTVEEIMETGSSDVYVVRAEGREYLIPAIEDAVRDIDIEANKMTVKLMEEE
jgi:16S rRNA processing protein RimM